MMFSGFASVPAVLQVRERDFASNNVRVRPCHCAKSDLEGR
jgi:hypothetical protein